MPERRPWPYASEDDAREAMLAAAGAPGAAPGSVSLSLRWRRSGAAGFLLTARSALPFGKAQVTSSASTARLEGIRWLTLADSPVDERRADPSMEWRLHRAVFRQRSDVFAIIRSRPVFSTALACDPSVQEAGIPAFHPDVLIAGGDSIRCAAHAPLGSPSLSGHVLAALQGRSACLLAARGLLAIGPSLQEAMDLSAEIEALAQIYCQVLQLRGAAAGLRGPAADLRGPAAV